MSADRNRIARISKSARLRFAGHTKGPWQAAYMGAGDTGPGGWQVQSFGVAINSEGTYRDDRDNVFFKKEDAELCAAAPELLAENERAHEFFEAINGAIHDARKYDRHSQPVHSAADAVLEIVAENERLKADLARVSVEFGLPPTIGPAPGEIARILAELRARVASANESAGAFRARIDQLHNGYREAIESMQLQQEVDAHRAVLDGVIESVQAYHAYLAAQLRIAHP